VLLVLLLLLCILVVLHPFSVLLLYYHPLHTLWNDHTHTHTITLPERPNVKPQ
jgi:hypothetical protein